MKLIVYRIIVSWILKYFNISFLSSFGQKLTFKTKNHKAQYFYKDIIKEWFKSWLPGFIKLFSIHSYGNWLWIICMILSNDNRISTILYSWCYCYTSLAISFIKLQLSFQIKRLLSIQDPLWLKIKMSVFWSLWDW